MYEDRHLFDTSDYDRDHLLYDTLNKKVIGKMKDQMHSIPIQEFVGLTSKMFYDLRRKGTSDGEEDGQGHQEERGQNPHQA
jgi:hypothetical protein